jgi:hypothetical protein
MTAQNSVIRAQVWSENRSCARNPNENPVQARLNNPESE